MAAGRSLGLRLGLAAAALVLSGVAAGSPGPRRIALRLSEGFEAGPGLERFTASARTRGIEVQSASESTAVPAGWEVAHLARIPPSLRLQPALARFPVAFEPDGFVFDGRKYSGKDDAIFLASPGAADDAYVLGLSESSVVELAVRRLLDRPDAPADYAVRSGELTKQGLFVEKDGRLAIDPASGRDQIAERDEYFKGLRREKRGALEWEYPAAQAAAAARWEKVAARWPGKKPYSVRLFPDAVAKALYTGSSRPADLVVEGGRIRVEIDASAPGEPDLVSPVLAAAAIGAANPALLERRTLLLAAGVAPGRQVVGARSARLRGLHARGGRGAVGRGGPEIRSGRVPGSRDRRGRRLAGRRSAPRERGRGRQGDRGRAGRARGRARALARGGLEAGRPAARAAAVARRVPPAASPAS